MALAVVCAGMVGAEGCASGNGSPPHSSEAMAAGGHDAWRPSWWIESPEHSGGAVTVAAMGTETSLLAARQAALRAGREALAAELGGEPTHMNTVKSDSTRAGGGKYRVFVLVRGGK